MESKRTATTYFIPPGKFLLMENALGNPDLIQSSVSSDCRVTIVDIANFPLDELEQWPTFRLTSPDIKLKLGEGSYYIYIVVPTPDNTETNTAFISYNTAWVDRYGYDADGKLLGKEKFCYYQCGIVSARGGNAGAVTVPPGKGRRIDIDLGVNPQDAALEKKVDWDYLNKMFKPHFDNPDNPEELTWIEALSNLGVAGGVNSYIQSKGMDIPGIYDGLPIDNITLYWELLPDGKKVLKSLGTGSSDTPGGGVADSVAWSNITGKPTWLLDNKIHYSEIDDTPDLSSYASKEWIAEQSFASSEALDSLQNALNTFLTGSDVDDVINKWRELETFLSGMKESDNLSSILKGKADSATTLAGYGIADAYTKTEVDKKLSSYVTLDGKQTITGEKTLTGILKANGGIETTVNSGSIYHKVTNGNGSVGLYASDNRGLYDFKTSRWIIATNGTNTWVTQGLFGVGTADPKYKFHLVGNGWVDGYLYSQRFVVPSGSTYSRFSIFGADNTESMWIQAGGYDGTSPYGILNISGVNANALAELKMLSTKTAISGTLDVGGITSVPSLKVNGGTLTYDKTKKYWKLDGDLLVTGGVASYSSDETFKPSTVMDGVLVDDVTIRKNDNGRLEVIGGNGGLNLDELSAYLYDNEYVNSVGVSGSGNAVTSASISGNKLTLTKGSTFALSSDLGSYAKKATTLAGYGITNAYTKIESDGKFLVKTNSEYYGVDFNSTLEDGSVRVLLRNGDASRVGIGYASKRAYLTNYVTGKELWIEDKLSFNGEGVFDSLYAAGTLTSNVADGTAPLVVKSTTKVTNLNADMVDGFSVSGAGFLYKKSVSVTDTTNSVWYVKVVLDVGWNHNRHEILIQPNYNNVNGIVLIEFESHAASLGYRVKAANYNGCNCTGFVLARNTSSSKLELCLRMAGGASASANIQSTLNIVSSSKMTASEGAAVSWIELTKQTISSNYAHVIDSSLSVTSNVIAGKDLILSGTLKSMFDETSYSTFQNHNNGNISVNAATGDLYLGYVNTKSVVCSSPVIPYNHNELKLGTSAKRWQCIYGVNGDFTSQMSAKTLRVNGGNLTFDPSKLAWQLEGDLVVTGGVASYSSLSSFTPSTIMDGVLVDDKTIKKNTDGKLEVIGGTGGGSGNIKTVSALPSNPQPDTLYILV